MPQIETMTLDPQQVDTKISEEYFYSRLNVSRRETTVR